MAKRRFNGNEFGHVSGGVRYGEEFTVNALAPQSDNTLRIKR